MKKFLLIGFCILGLFGCAEPEYIEHTGVVIDKKYFPEKAETYTVPVWIGKTVIQQVRTRTIPEKYILRVSYTVKKDIEIEVSEDEYTKTLLGNTKVFKEEI